MGKLKPILNFTGSVAGLSVYTMRGSDQPIIRRKGGPTRKQIKTKDSFATTRKNNMEFGGRAKITAQVMDVLRPLKYLGDYNIAGPLNSLFIPIQELDTKHEKGHRDVQLTKDPRVLEGFNLNRRTPFESIVLNPPEYTLSKKTLKGAITFPELTPDRNFIVPGNFQWYRFIVVLGIVEDMFCDPGSRWDDYHAKHGNPLWLAISRETDWLEVYPGSPSTTFNIEMKISRKDYLKQLSLNCHSLMLGVGISFGTMQKGKITMAKYIGGAKVLGMA
ncbi:hypothetical protein FAM09_29920 [Niastella caeni]|uniref:Uncharacterized protein n=1 Tax=Niastella caeni TaxID=2569763 RepID=A0A4S8H736_9BACT|nr:hypothetical protein [Niastella caeni]THU30377.1 hypothetical protein FAM09_29920 [Niastella caeni]